MSHPDLRLHPRAHGCGKVILMGEHAVVHGEPALAAGLPGGLDLSALPLPDPQAPTRVRIPDWDLDLELRVGNEHPVARACLAVLNQCDGPLRGWQIEGRSGLPSRAGLGSSATLSVALARLVLGPEAEAALLAECAQVGEEVFHGTPSGIDAAVAAAGGVIRFCRGAEPRALTLGRPLPLAVIPSGIPRSTADQVAKVHRRLERHPSTGRELLAGLREATNACQVALEGGDLERVGELFDIGHGLLGAFDVSSPELDALAHAARAAGALGAKLTGAGGGGSLIAVAEDPAPIVDHFTARGLAAFSVVIESSGPTPG